jgi:LysM repeat protein
VEETPAPELEPAPPVPDPEPAQPEIAPEPADASDVEEAAPAGEIIHVVVRGDVPGSIADKYGVPLKDLLAWNDMTRQSILHIGDKLVVRVPGGEAGATPAEPEEAPSIPEPVPEPAPEPEPEPAPAPEPEPETESAPAGAQPDGTERVFHTVARGEFPGKIADKYGVSVDDFFEWNNLTKRSTLHVGDKYVVYIPGDKDKPAAQPSPSETSSTVSADGERIVHVVGRGDNPWSLSRKYGVQVQDIYDWNKWERGHTLHVGDEVILYKKGR